jgi:hypothetical protein
MPSQASLLALLRRVLPNLNPASFRALMFLELFKITRNDGDLAAARTATERISEQFLKAGTILEIAIVTGDERDFALAEVVTQNYIIGVDQEEHRKQVLESIKQARRRTRKQIRVEKEGNDNSRRKQGRTRRGSKIHGNPRRNALRQR